MTKHALIIGCGEYPAADIENLPGAQQDARAVCGTLTLPGIGGFDDAHVKLLINPDLGQMQREIQALFGNKSKDDLVLLYYSGHGLKDLWGDDFYLACRDSEAGEYLDSTTVHADFIRKRMAKSSAGKQILILDCCFSGMFADDLPGHCQLALLTSSGKLEYSRAAENLSPYTLLLVNALESGAAAAGKDKTVSAGGLHEYIVKNLRAEGMKPEIHARKAGHNLIVAHAPAEDFIAPGGGIRHDPLRARYLQYLIKAYRDHTIRGFAPRVSGRDVSLPLAKVFLPLQAVEGRPALTEYAEQDLQRQAAGEFMAEPGGELDWTRRREDLEKRAARLAVRQAAQRPLRMNELLRRERIVFLGDPGSGKTTITRYLAYALAAGDYSHTGSKVKGLLPLLVRIANYGKAYEQNGCHLLDYLADKNTPAPDFGPLLRRAVQAGECLVILDGLDEVTEPQLRMQVTQRIQEMVAAYPACRYLVTSRIVGYDLSPLTREFTHATLSPLEDADRERFVRLWYAAIHAEIGEAEEQPLIEALRNKPQIARMAANPLLLTIMVLMHWRGTKLPNRRVQVYEGATDTLVEYWTSARGIELDAEEVKRILAPVAFFILSASVGGVIARHALVPLIEQNIQAQRGCDAAEARRLGRALLKNLNEQSGIFLERGRDAEHQPVFGFLHLTFGEYLAALEISRQVLDGEFQLADHIHRGAWHESLLLAVGDLSLRNPRSVNQLLREILAFPALYEAVLRRNLLLAADCLADDVQVEPGIRDEVLRGLAELLDKKQAWELQQAALAVYKRLGVTRHAEAGVEMLDQVHGVRGEKATEKHRDQNNLIQALLYLGARDLARPLLWPKTGPGEYKAIDRLRFEYWPEQAAEYVLACRRAALEKQRDFPINLYGLGGLDWSLLIHVLGKISLQNLLGDLLEIESRQTDKDAARRAAVLVWLLVILSEQSEPEILRIFLAPDQNPELRRTAAQALLESLLRDEALDTLRELVKGEAGEAATALALLLEAGEDAGLDWTLLEYSALHADGSALLCFLQGERLNVLLPALLYALAFNQGDIWDALRNLLKYPATRDLGLAALRWTALKPGSVWRLEACEGLLENGQAEAAIPLLLFLAYTPGYHSQYACKRLLLLREQAGILPLLARDANAQDANLRYQSCLSLALCGVDIQADTLKENDINVQRDKRLARHTESCRQAVDDLVNSAQALLEQIQDMAPALRALARLSLLYLQNTPPGPDRAENDLRDLAQNPLTCTHALLFALRCRHWKAIEQGKQALLQNLPTLPISTARRIGVQTLTRLADTQAVPVLTAALQDEDSDVRNAAAKALGRTGGEQAESALVAALRDEDLGVRHAAAEALGRTGGEQAVPALAAALQDEDLYMRHVAAHALGRTNGEQAVPVLAAALQNKDSYVCRTAAYALGRIGGAQAVPALAAALQNKNSDVCRIAACALGRIGGEQAVFVLAAALQDESANARSAAVYALGRTGGKQAVPVLAAALQDGNWQVRRAAAYALGRTGGEQAVPVLAAALQDESANVRRTAAYALGWAGGEQAVSVLTAALQDEAESVRSAAAYALERAGGEQAVSVLAAALQDEAEFVRSAAAEALGRIGGEQAMPVLTTALQEENWQVCSAAVYALGRAGGEQAVPVLAAAFEDSDVRGTAAHALAQIGGEQAGPALAITYALGRIGGKQAVSILTAALQDEYSNMRNAAACVLGRIGGEQAEPVLTAALQDNDSNVRNAAAEALGRIGGKQAVSVLAAALQDESWPVRNVVVLHDKSWPVRSAAAEALGRIGDTESVPLLQAMAADWSTSASYFNSEVQNHNENQAAQSCVRPLIALAPEAALEVLDTYARQFRSDIWPLRLRGCALWKLKREAEALICFTRAAASENNALNHLALAHWHLEHGDLEAAAQAAEHAWQQVDKKDDEETALCLLTRAVIARVRGEIEQAAELYQKARRWEPYLAREAEELRYRHQWRVRALDIFRSLHESI
ncbi:MAG: NACHT domain-containing protein [Gammaproteobacteria bacterium]|nr:NACHT domain-containing protein [Gammaproteobacteria bacterium]